MKFQFKEVKEYKTIDKDNKQVLSPNKVVAQCYYQGHPGYLNNKMMIKHKCREKNCKYLALNYNHSLNYQQLKEKYEKYFQTLITLKQIGYISDEMYNYYHKKDYQLMQEFYSLDNWLYKLHKRKQRLKLFKKIKAILLIPFDKIIRAYRKHKWLNRQKKFKEEVKPKQEIIDRFNKNGYTVIHLFGDLYLVRNYSKNHPKHKYFSLYNLEIIR